MSSPDALRAAALALPEAVEQEHFGVASWRVGGKIFAQLTTRPGIAILKLPKPRQELLFALRPEAFTAMVWGRLVWANVALAEVEDGELADLARDAWRQVAPKRLLASLA